MHSISRQESRRIDQAAQRELLLPGELLMENAGARAAEETRNLARRQGATRVIVVAGPGNNGGDGYVIARHLAGIVELDLFRFGSTPQPASDAGRNLARLEKIGVGVTSLDAPTDRLEPLLVSLRGNRAIVVDALFGTGLDREIDGLARQIIESIQQAGHPVLAIDLPSGLDADRGVVLGVAIRATLTVTFVAPKLGFSTGRGPDLCGEVVVVPIGFPPERLSAPGPPAASRQPGETTA